MSERGRRPWRLVPTTLRARITAVAALAVLVVLTGASVGLVLAQRAALVEAVDESLDLQADAVVGRLQAGEQVRDRDLPAEDVVVEVIGPDGTLVASSPGVQGRLPGVEVNGDGDGGDGNGGEGNGGEGNGGDARITTVDLPGDDGEGRLLSRTVGGTTVLVAGTLEDVADSTAALAGPLVIAVPLTTVVLAGVVWWAVGGALRPVEAIRARVDSISAARLDRRVPEPEAPREVARLARTMNAMLGRLQRAADEQRRFVGDASHELRTPLARMRAELEVDAAHPGSADPAATAGIVLGEVIGLQRLVEDLLLLARGDSGALVAVRTDPLDLDDVVARVLRARADPRIDALGVSPVQVPGDPEQLERVVRNLLDNAVRHARERITVTLSEDPASGAVLTVADDGPGIPAAAAERVFERFTRLDDARAADDGGAGLGLAIARDIAERHGGSLSLDSPASGGARFVLRLPASPAGGDAV